MIKSVNSQNIAEIQGATRLNGVERNKKSPKTFLIPDEIERKSVAIGNFVKLGIEHPIRGGERFWVKVTDLKKNGFDYTGVVDNKLLFYPELEVGSTYHFNKEHILTIIRKE